MREAASKVPLDRLLAETDAPCTMTPEPMRGMVCGPDHVLLPAERLAEVRGCAPGPKRAAFAASLANARELLDRDPTPWQQEAAREFYAEAFDELSAKPGVPYRSRSARHEEARAGAGEAGYARAVPGREGMSRDDVKERGQG